MALRIPGYPCLSAWIEGHGMGIMAYGVPDGEYGSLVILALGPGGARSHVVFCGKD